MTIILYGMLRNLPSFVIGLALLNVFYKLFFFIGQCLLMFSTLFFKNKSAL